jgi:hypothetical protein
MHALMQAVHVWRRMACASRAHWSFYRSSATQLDPPLSRTLYNFRADLYHEGALSASAEATLILFNTNLATCRASCPSFSGPQTHSLRRFTFMRPRILKCWTPSQAPREDPDEHFAHSLSLDVPVSLRPSIMRGGCQSLSRTSPASQFLILHILQWTCANDLLCSGRLLQDRPSGI